MVAAAAIENKERSDVTVVMSQWFDPYSSRWLARDVDPLDSDDAAIVPQFLARRKPDRLSVVSQSNT